MWFIIPHNDNTGLMKNETKKKAAAEIEIAGWDGIFIAFLNLSSLCLFANLCFSLLL